ncbi:hypothetical protein BGZ96_002511 [Linnemannia gamsii]|uniref:Very-long-chain (3R)-3-hydroxyacyl-CoA dehydratase n=1 Tax=Linnemannia gamsii TaxID=64522 RepID=A0ABQ7K7X4_9FUNG|nr:hypothetical protein BGZ96_002511 [Linnemannia gamsii]
MPKTTSQTPAASSGKKAPKPVNPVINAYLIAYNWASFAGWSWVLVQTVRTLLATGGDYSKVYAVVGDKLVWVQTAALLEVASRLLLVWGICTLFPVPEVRSYWAFTTMTIAWCITECIRYAYYALNLVNMGPSFLVWCRYTFFYILYPVGAGSEAIEIYQSLPFAHTIHPAYYYFLVAMLCIYPPGFFVMYTHMFAQRKRYLGPSKAKKSQ